MGCNRADQLKPTVLRTLSIAITHQRFDKMDVFAITQRFSVETKINISGTNMAHIVMV